MLVLNELQKAFLQAGVPAELAEKVAAVNAGYENRLTTIESTQRLHSWILTTNTAILVALLFKVFSL